LLLILRVQFPPRVSSQLKAPNVNYELHALRVKEDDKRDPVSETLFWQIQDNRQYPKFLMSIAAIYYCQKPLIFK
jgi:hypothetical protein